MIGVILIDAEASSHEEFAGLILPYGASGFKQVYKPVDYDTELILSTESLEFKDDDEEFEIEEMMNVFNMMKKNEKKEYELQSGQNVVLIKDKW